MITVEDRWVISLVRLDGLGRGERVYVADDDWCLGTVTDPKRAINYYSLEKAVRAQIEGPEMFAPYLRDRVEPGSFRVHLLTLTEKIVDIDLAKCYNDEVE